MEHLPTFTMKINQTQVNIPDMDPLGLYDQCIVCLHSTPRNHQLSGIIIYVYEYVWNFSLLHNLKKSGICKHDQINLDFWGICWVHRGALGP